jgi:DedD protein
MEIKGEEFLKNVQSKQESENMQEHINHINENEPAAYVETSQNFQQKTQQEQELANIMLEEAPVSNNNDNKKKYLVLGLILIILFLTTILMVRLLNDDSSETNDFNQKQKTSAVKNESSIDEEYKKILDNRVNRQTTTSDNQNTLTEETVDSKEDTTEEQKNSIDEKMDKIIEKINNKEVIQEEKKTPKSLFVRKERPTYTPPKKVYTPKEEKVVKTEVKRNIFSNTSTKPRGYFIQVGAFSKAPSSSFISKIKKANLKYTIHKVEVKGRFYNKVLIGPYSSKAKASSDMARVKTKLNISSSYVLKF